MRLLGLLSALLLARVSAQGARDDNSCQVIGETSLPDFSSYDWQEDFFTPRDTTSVSPGQTKTDDYFFDLEGACTVDGSRDPSSQMALVLYPSNILSSGTVTIDGTSVSFSGGQCIHFRDYTTKRDPRPIRISCSRASTVSCRFSMHRYCTTNGSRNISAGAIVGIVIGVLVVLACCVAIPVFFCAGATAGLCCAGWRRRQREPKPQTVVMHTVHTQSVPAQQQPVTYTYGTGMPQQQQYPPQQQYPQQQQYQQQQQYPQQQQQYPQQQQQYPAQQQQPYQPPPMYNNTQMNTQMNTGYNPNGMPPNNPSAPPA
ncbi:MAG: hypothetical protein MHM6MM_000782 [Cercozoa sp. M6MM]